MEDCRVSRLAFEPDGSLEFIWEIYEVQGMKSNVQNSVHEIQCMKQNETE